MILKWVHQLLNGKHDAAFQMYVLNSPSVDPCENNNELPSRFDIIISFSIKIGRADVQ